MTTLRERWLLTLLPTVLIVLVWFGWLRPTAKHLAVTKALEAATKTAPTPDILSLAKKEEAESRTKLATAQQQREQLQIRWKSLQQELGPGSERSIVIEQIAAVMRDNRLKWIDAKLTTDGSEGESGKQFIKLLDKLREPLAIPKSNLPEQPVFGQPASPTNLASPDRVPTRVLWKVDFAGSYADVQAALEELQTAVPQAVPVSLRMSEAKPNFTLRLWTLIFAI